MQPPLIVHVALGGIGLVSGFTALSLRKGNRPHRRAGTVFVYSMIGMALLGSALAVNHLRDDKLLPAIQLTVLMGIFTSYLVFTASAAVRPPSDKTRVLNAVGMVAIFSVSVGMLSLGGLAVASPTGHHNGLPPAIYFVFGSVAVLAFAGDVRVVHSGALSGAPRLARHLWRMCFALFIAAFSFGPRLTKFLPKPIGTYLVLLPGIIALVAMLSWLWRLRSRKASALLARPLQQTSHSL